MLIKILSFTNQRHNKTVYLNIIHVMLILNIQNSDQSERIFNSYRGLGRVLKFALFSYFDMVGSHGHL